MAIDTHDKRRSVLGTILPFLAVYPVADGTVSGVDKQHAGGDYRGIAAQTVPDPRGVYVRVIRQGGG